MECAECSLCGLHTSCRVGRYQCWSYGVMVSTLDSESSDPGSNPVGPHLCRANKHRCARAPRFCMAPRPRPTLRLPFASTQLTMALAHAFLCGHAPFSSNTQSTVCHAMVAAVSTKGRLDIPPAYASTKSHDHALLFHPRGPNHDEIGMGHGCFSVQ